MDRREFLRIGTAAAAALIVQTGYAKPNAPLERSLGFYNTHTDETLRTVYWAEGHYQPDGLREINRILRDHRTGDIHAMDERLLDLLYVLQTRTGSRDKFHVISGYRSPVTNAKLNARSSGVARHSYHMQGMAIDIRLPGYDLKQLHQAALALKAGGVGCYPASNFIHVDVGPVRRW
jgi:uncharacterized protein YcbK (DUF882 family)